MFVDVVLTLLVVWCSPKKLLKGVLAQKALAKKAVKQMISAKIIVANTLLASAAAVRVLFGFCLNIFIPFYCRLIVWVFSHVICGTFFLANTTPMVKPFLWVGSTFAVDVVLLSF